MVHSILLFFFLLLTFCIGCNVGYAFVNFITVQDLLTFAKKRLGQKWYVSFLISLAVAYLDIARNMFSSDKILHLSYANYQ